MVAKCWSKCPPEEVPAMVLINTSMRPYSPFHHRLRPATYAALIRMALGSEPARREETILRLASARGAAPDALPAWSGYACERPVSRVNALRQLLAAARFRANGAPVATHVLTVTRKQRGDDGMGCGGKSQRLDRTRPTDSALPSQYSA